jgi:hypothetical protein
VEPNASCDIVVNARALLGDPTMMSQSAGIWAVRPDAQKFQPESEEPALNEAPVPSTLAATLLAIRQRRGALFMLDASRWLIESWNLASDCLHEQSEETVQLVKRLLKS